MSGKSISSSFCSNKSNSSVYVGVYVLTVTIGAPGRTRGVRITKIAKFSSFDKLRKLGLIFCLPFKTMFCHICIVHLISNSNINSNPIFQSNYLTSVQIIIMQLKNLNIISKLHNNQKGMRTLIDKFLVRNLKGQKLERQ